MTVTASQPISLDIIWTEETAEVGVVKSVKALEMLGGDQKDFILDWSRINSGDEFKIILRAVLRPELGFDAGFVELAKERKSQRFNKSQFFRNFELF